MATVSNPGELASAHWIGVSPDFVPEFWPPEFDDRPHIAFDMEPVLCLRARFHVGSGLVRARMATTARGVYRGYLEGRRVGDDEYAPGWTDYRRRIAVQSHDVTGLLVDDLRAEDADVTWSIELADGWYAGYLGMDRRHQAGIYGRTTAARGALVLDYADGTRQTVRTGPDWRMGSAEIRYADLLMGQLTDFGFDPDAWKTSSFDDSSFAPVWSDPSLDVELVDQLGPSVRVRGVRAAESITATDTGLIVDFGQNLVGRVRLRVPGTHPGARIHLRHGEVLDDEGRLYTENLRTARAHDIVVSSSEERVFEPHFTVHGFRYAEVSGYPGELAPEDVAAVVVGSDVDRVGAFACSDARIERLERNIGWTIAGNLLSVPTDCPQRDERLGWMGDAQLIMPTAHQMFDMGGFVGKWLVDIRDGQFPNGAYPDVAPRAVVEVEGAPGWADAGVLVPWVTHRFTGDAGPLADHYASMVRFMDHLERENPDGIRERAVSRNYGDWLSLGAPTPKVVVATGYWKRCADAMAEMARALGRDDARWRATSERIARAFRDRFVSADGVVSTGTQTAYALALEADLIPAALRGRAGQHLAGAVAAAGDAVTTGIHGLRALMPALATTGQLPVAYALLEREAFPSWLYPLSRGATTVWERWDGISPERGFQTPTMNSFNHYALGSVGEWLYGYAAGLLPEAERPGFAHSVVRPFPGGSLTACGVRRRVAGGEIAVGWRIEGATIALDVTVPEGATASVLVPTTSPGSARDTAGGLRGSAGEFWDRFEAAQGAHRFEAVWSGPWAPLLPGER